MTLRKLLKIRPRGMYHLHGRARPVARRPQSTGHCYRTSLQRASQHSLQFPPRSSQTTRDPQRQLRKDLTTPLALNASRFYKASQQRWQPAYHEIQPLGQDGWETPETPVQQESRVGQTVQDERHTQTGRHKNED